MKTNHLILAAMLTTSITVSVLSFSTNESSRKPSKENLKTTKAILLENPLEQLSVSAASKKATVLVGTNPKSTPPAKCVFKTAFEGEGLDKGFYYKIPGKVMASLDKGLEWMEKAQSNDGGWGAGSHQRQNISDPHAVSSDPATTAMVAMAIQRCGSDLQSGPYSKQLKKALQYLLEQVESAPDESLNITSITQTQPQVKLGQNIDVVLTSQFLTNILSAIENDAPLKNRVKKSISKCVAKIENGHNANGSLKGSGWAGVLQSSFATSALEAAKDNGIDVDEEILDKSRDYQKGNIDTETDNVVTESAAGVVLYSVSGSTRASSKETGEAKATLKKAKKEGKILNEEVTVENLKKAGLSESKALKYKTAYQVNKSSKKLSQDDQVVTGFGNNGGEEFLSFLQTGEGMIMSRDNDWQGWYDKTSGRLLGIQNEDGSWNGHHCITSPVFCTATCLLILSVNNDIEQLTGQ
ncbi:MAG: terpene cyclase/mutase family protein [Bacteroidetes bacterium]|nr:terpene cyclase/mutase family protein [Bacteroidota bacterium]